MRPLTGLPPEQQREVWAAAEAAAPRDAQGQPKITGRIVAEAAGKVVPLRRSASVTLRPGVPEESAHALLQAWEPRDLVKFYSELVVTTKSMLVATTKNMLVTATNSMLVVSRTPAESQHG